MINKILTRFKAHSFLFFIDGKPYIDFKVAKDFPFGYSLNLLSRPMRYFIQKGAFIHAPLLISLIKKLQDEQSNTSILIPITQEQSKTISQYFGCSSKVDNFWTLNLEKQNSLLSKGFITSSTIINSFITSKFWVTPLNHLLKFPELFDTLTNSNSTSRHTIFATLLFSHLWKKWLKKLYKKSCEIFSILKEEVHLIEKSIQKAEAKLTSKLTITITVESKLNAKELENLLEKNRILAHTTDLSTSKNSITLYFPVTVHNSDVKFAMRKLRRILKTLSISN